MCKLVKQPGRCEGTSVQPDVGMPDALAMSLAFQTIPDLIVLRLVQRHLAGHCRLWPACGAEALMCLKVVRKDASGPVHDSPVCLQVQAAPAQSCRL